MRNSCNVLVEGIASCFTSPGSVRQASGVSVRVAGTGLGVKVTLEVGVKVEGMAVWVGVLSFGLEQAVIEASSVIQVIKRSA